MDPTVARILDDLKELLMAKAISPAEYLEHTLAHTRAYSVEKEAPVKMESLDTEIQEALVKTEVKNDSTERRCDEDPGVGVSVFQETSKWVQERDHGVIIPGVEVSATKGMTEHVAEEDHVLIDPKANASILRVSLESTAQWFLCQQKPNPKFFVEQPPSYLTPFGGSSVTDTSWACCQNFGVYVGRNLTVRVVFGAAFGDPRVEDPGVEGREDVSGVCELTLTQGTERATRGGRAAPLY